MKYDSRRKHLHVEPDDGEDDAEGGRPAERPRRPALHAGLDLLEVDDERVGGEEHDEDAERHAERDVGAGDQHLADPNTESLTPVTMSTRLTSENAR